MYGYATSIGRSIIKPFKYLSWMIIDDDRRTFAFLWSESDAINDDYTLTEKCIMPNFVAQ